MNDLISVIVPVFKVELYLDKCIQSIVEQNYKNIESILVDDGSPDRCPQMCDHWAARDKRITVIHKSNGGLSDARNTGIESATGKYVVFVDSDDYIDNRFIECLYTQILETKAQISSVDMLLFDDSTKIVRDEEYHVVEVFNRKEAISALFDPCKFQNFMCNKMFERRLFDTIKFPRGHMMEDLAVAYKLIEQCDLVSYCPVKLYYYYQRTGSILHGVNLDYLKDWYTYSKEKYLYIKVHYPEMDVNYQHFNLVVLECYPLLEKKEALFASQEFKRNKKYKLNKPGWKNQVKFILFSLSKRLYSIVWTLWRK